MAAPGQVCGRSAVAPWHARGRSVAGLEGLAGLDSGVAAVWDFLGWTLVRLDLQRGRSFLVSSKFQTVSLQFEMPSNHPDKLANSSSAAGRIFSGAAFTKWWL